MHSWAATSCCCVCNLTQLLVLALCQPLPNRTLASLHFPAKGSSSSSCEQPADHSTLACGWQVLCRTYQHADDDCCFVGLAPAMPQHPVAKQYASRLIRPLTAVSS